MTLKLLINFYRWIWAMPPLVIQEINDLTFPIILFGAAIDIVVIYAIVVYAIRAYRKKAR